MKKYKIKYPFYALLITFVAAIPILIYKSANDMNNSCQMLLPSKMDNLSASTSQLLVVKSLGGFNAEVIACQLQGNVWQRALTQSSFPAVIGKNGLVSVEEKKEGDLKTPTGLYPLGEAFGSQPLALKMDYRYITSEDKFIDDVTSAHYNAWVTGTTDAKSYESMLIAPYKMGVVINYNMDPIIAGAGSGIFMHLWRSSNNPTSGCVAMDERHLSAILQWLDKKQHPYIYITTL
jgi:L,D-peptidoglycan transpeptidase YkuD (ErfK/YbiS/YcfS/YnhG family)